MYNGDAQNEKGTPGGSQSASASNPNSSNVVLFPEQSRLSRQAADGTFAVAGASVDKIGGGNRDRTCDLEHAMLALSQLSYTPTLKSCFIELMKHDAKGNNFSR